MENALLNIGQGKIRKYRQPPASVSATGTLTPPVNCLKYSKTQKMRVSKCTIVSYLSFGFIVLGRAPSYSRMTQTCLTFFTTITLFSPGWCITLSSYTWCRKLQFLQWMSIHGCKSILTVTEQKLHHWKSKYGYTIITLSNFCFRFFFYFFLVFFLLDF